MAMTFRVNLSTLNDLNSKQPYNRSTEGENFSETRVAYFPNNLLFNRYLSRPDGTYLRHGDTFTASGYEALYIKNNYTTGSFKFLDYVEGDTK